MGHAQNQGKTNKSVASDTKAIGSNQMGKEASNSEAQMDIDLEEDDLLGEEEDVSDAVRDFVGVRKGHSVDVRVAVPSGSLAPACL
jgi:hypothetical protein